MKLKDLKFKKDSINPCTSVSVYVGKEMNNDVTLLFASAFPGYST